MWFGVTTSDGQAFGSLAADGISEMRIDKHRSVVVGQRVQDALVEVRDKRQRSFPVSLGPGVWAAVVPAKTSLTVSFRDGGRLLGSDAWETMARPLPLWLRLRGKGGASSSGVISDLDVGRVRRGPPTWRYRATKEVRSFR
jgi:hypothetical protein